MIGVHGPGELHSSQVWYLNPLQADTNRDGRPDGLECAIWSQVESYYDPAGVCPDTDGNGVPDVFDIDNDGDGVQDQYDISSDTAGSSTFNDANPFSFSIENLQVDNSIIVDFQFRPTNPGHLSYQTRVLDWPGNDNAGQIQRVMTTTFATTDNTDIRSSIYNASKETEYAFTFEDLVLDPASFVHPCSAGDLEIQSYGGDSALGDHIFKVSGSCRVDGHQRGNETVTACDMSGLCTDVTASPMDGLNATPPGQTPDDPIIGETGSVTLDGTIDKGISALITYQGIYTEPVVVAFLATFNEPEPVDVQVRNLTINGFEIFMEEPGGDLTHASETVNYIVMESGRYTLDGGLVVEAGKCDTATVHVSGMAPGGDNVAFNNLFYV